MLFAGNKYLLLKRITVCIHHSQHRHMNVKIGTEAAKFTEKEYINGIFLAVCVPCYLHSRGKFLKFLFCFLQQ